MVLIFTEMNVSTVSLVTASVTEEEEEEEE
jgi:hypothetical protein